MSDVAPSKPFDPAASLGVKVVNRKKKNMSFKQRMRKEKASDKGEAAKERFLTKTSKKLSKKLEKEKWKTLY